MKLIRLICFLSVAIFTSICINAQTDSVMRFSLKQAQDYAIENFYVSKNAKLDIEKAKKVVLEATSFGLPQVNASASWTYIPGTIPTIDFGSSMGDMFSGLFYALDTAGIYHADPSAFAGEPTPISEKSTITYGFTVSQLVFSGEYIVGLQASRVYKILTEEINDKTEIGLKESVANGYFSLLILERNRLILEKTIENLNTILTQTEAYYKAGFVEDTDVDQLTLMLLNAGNSLKTIDRQIELLYQLFNYQLGISRPVKVELTENLDDLVVINIVNDSAYNFILEDNIDFKMLDTQERLQKFALNLKRMEYLPTIAGFYQYQDKDKKTAFDFTIKHIIGVSVEVPIFQSGTRIAATSQARIEYEKAQNTKEQEIQRIMMEADQAIFNYRTALEKYENEKMGFELSENIYNKTTEKYKQGILSSIDLTAINNQYLQAQMTYAAAIQELLSAKVKLDKAYNQL